MAIEIDGVEYLTTAEAVELAEEMGQSITRRSVTRAALRGERGVETGIPDCAKIGDATSAWLIPRPAFIQWLKDRKPRGLSK
ncbi:hypothetical protein KC887_08870 [Candidatus Kaiserbacteria bacterium]|nr:hypothetical protein [Candidatus Kaiserbacteria bacterium]